MRKTFAFSLWAVLGVAILVIVLSLNPLATFSSPSLDSSISVPATFIGLAVGMVILWGAFYLTFKLHIQVFIGDVVVLVAVLLWRLYKWVRLKIESAIWTQKAAKLAEKTIDVAATNAQVLKVHPKLMADPTTVVLGYDKRKNPISIDLRAEHTLYAGSTGAGKTNLLAALLVQIFSKPALSRPRVYVLDLKGNIEDELHKFKGLAEYVNDIDASLALLHDLNVAMGQRQKEQWDKPILVFIDEVADLTAGSEDASYNHEAIRFLTLLARKGRSAGIHLHVFTQHPRYDVLQKAIANNLLRKVCLRVDTMTQAEVIFGFKPDFDTPTKFKPGDFLLKEGTHTKLGHTLLKTAGEIDSVLSGQAENFDDKRYRIWRTLSVGKDAGDNVTGIQRFVNEHKDDGEFGQVFVKLSYRHLVAAGVLSAPGKKGESYKMAVSFLDGLPMVKTYIGEGKWSGEPDAFLSVRRA